MKRTLIITLTALSLGSAALAEDTTVSLPGNVTASVKDAWAAFVTAGGTAELLAADRTVIGTLNADGTLTLKGTSTISDVKSVKLIPAEGDPITVNVTRDLSRPGAIKIEYTDASGRTQSLPLPAVMNRMKADTSADEAEAPTGEGETKGGKRSANPGKGKR